MPELIIIVAQTLNRVIGKENKMPWHLPKDLQHFKKMTLNHPVLMGRNTYESIGKALPKRRNIIITRDPDYKKNDAESFTSPEAAIQSLRDEEKIFIIGGAKIYETLLPLANKLIITWIGTQIKGDAFFPIIDERIWAQENCEKIVADEKNIYDLQFCTYLRKRAR